MDPEDTSAFLNRMHTTKESHLDVLRLESPQSVVTEATLDDDGIGKQLAEVNASIVKPLIGVPAPAPSWGPFVLLSAVGDLAFKSNPINISKVSLSNILLACGFPPFTLIACGLKRSHLSHHIEYDAEGGDEPVAMVLLLRIPWSNSSCIGIAMRIRLADLATVVLLTSMTKETQQNIRKRCIERRHLLKKHPLYFLALIYEDRCFEYKAWFDGILEGIKLVESATGMTRSTWKMPLSPQQREYFSDYDNLMARLHEINSELSHFSTMATFGVEFGDFVLAKLELLDELREEVGVEPLPKKDFRYLQGRLSFTRSRCCSTAAKTKEMLGRVKSQINVVISFVSQRDSKINLSLAEDSNYVAMLAARDSKTMKTIAVLTLLVLPSTLVTSIWSAELFQLETSLNWKVYLGVNLLLTSVVFTVWFLHLRMPSLSREQRPLHIAGVGYIRGGKVVDTGPTDREQTSFDVLGETNWQDK